MEIIIAYYSYRSGLIGNVIAFYSYPSDNMTKAITCKAVTFEVTFLTSALLLTACISCSFENQALS